MHQKNLGKPIGSRVRFSARDMMVSTNRRTGGKEYQRLEQAFERLVGTAFKTDIHTGGKVETRIFSLLSEGGFVRKEDSWRVDYCEVVLSDWLIRAVESAEIVTISPDYFRLRRPLERRIYEIARKHCGDQKRWHIGLANLQTKTGSNAPLKRFRLNLREIIENDHTPFYRIELKQDDLVIFRPRSRKQEVAPQIQIPDWAEEKAREIARSKGWDYYALRANWIAFAQSETAKGNPPKNPGAALVAYCKKQKIL
jgi:plasmid replication initiation protein